MSNLERQFLDNCDQSFKPHTYHRYVDDTFSLFNNLSNALKFLDYINNMHPNIKFTIEEETENKLSFQVIVISRADRAFSTSVFRKKNFHRPWYSFLQLYSL